MLSIKLPPAAQLTLFVFLTDKKKITIEHINLLVLVVLLVDLVTLVWSYLFTLEYQLLVVARQKNGLLTLDFY